MRAVVVVVLASCWSTPAKPAAPKPEPPVAAKPGLAVGLAGPFVDVAAYCATQPQGGDHECRVVDDKVATDGSALEAGALTELAIVYVTSKAPVFGCAIALRTSGGWFVSAPSDDACHEPSYIELRDVRTEVDGDVVTVQIDVNWHTKGPNRGNGDASADYTLTAFCGMAVQPVCTAIFTSKCEATAPASDCSTRGYEATWKLDAKTLTLESKPRSADANVPHGTHRLF